MPVAVSQRWPRGPITILPSAEKARFISRKTASGSPSRRSSRPVPGNGPLRQQGARGVAAPGCFGRELGRGHSEEVGIVLCVGGPGGDEEGRQKQASVQTEHGQLLHQGRTRPSALSPAPPRSRG